MRSQLRSIISGVGAAFAQARRYRRRRTFRMESLRIIGAGLLALVLLAGFLLYVRADAERRAFDAAAQSATWMVQLRAREYERFVDNARERLIDLGQRPEVRALEPDVCQATLAPQLSALPGYLDAGAARPTGE